MPASRRSREEIVRALAARDRTQVYPAEGLRVGRLWLDQGFALELHPSLPPAHAGALFRLYLGFTSDRRLVTFLNDCVITRLDTRRDSASE